MFLAPKDGRPYQTLQTRTGFTEAIFRSAAVKVMSIVGLIVALLLSGESIALADNADLHAAVRAQLVVIDPLAVSRKFRVRRL